MADGSILLIEDDYTTQKLLQSVLESEGYSVSTAGDGLKALLLAEQFKFGLIITDYSMPMLTGIETITILKAMHRHYRKVPVVITTTTPEIIDPAVITPLKVIKILPKPVDRKRFVSAIKKAFPDRAAA